MEIKEIDATDTYQLRHEILRPQQSIEQCKYPGDLDSSTIHYGVFYSKRIVGILSIYKQKHPEFHTSKCRQLRAMAIKEHMRGKGYAASLLAEAESDSLKKGATYIWLNARLKAVGFYEKYGYLRLGEKFDIAGIGPHYLMHKKIS